MSTTYKHPTSQTTTRRAPTSVDHTYTPIRMFLRQTSSRAILEPQATVEQYSSDQFNRGRLNRDTDFNIHLPEFFLTPQDGAPSEDVRSKWDEQIQNLEKALFQGFPPHAHRILQFSHWEFKESLVQSESGSYGTVAFLNAAMHPLLDQRMPEAPPIRVQVASKTPNNPEEYEKLLFEAALTHSLALVEGCSVVPLIGLLESADEKVKCEFVFGSGGKSLRSLQTEMSGYSLFKKLKIATTVTKAVLSLHALGVAHCDMHTGNILYSEKDDKTYLIDFGEAQLFNYHESKPKWIPSSFVSKSKDEAIMSDAVKLWDLWNELFKSELEFNDLQTSFGDHPFVKFCQERGYTPSIQQGYGSGSLAATQRNEETERLAYTWYNICRSECHQVLVGSTFFRKVVHLEKEADKTELIELLRSSGLGFEDIMLNNSFCSAIESWLKIDKEYSKPPVSDQELDDNAQYAEEFLRGSEEISLLMGHFDLSGLKNEAKKLRESIMRVYIIFMGLEESKKWLVHGSSSIKFFDYIEHFADSALSYKGDMLKEYVRIAISILKDFGEFQKGSNSPPYPWISDGTAKEAQRSLGRAAMDGYGQMYLLKENYLQVCLHIIKCLEGQPKQDPSFYTSLAKCLGWFDRQRHAKSNYFRELDKELGHLIESDPEKYLHQRIQIEQSNLGRVGIVLHFVSTYSSFFVTELFSSKVSL